MYSAIESFVEFCNEMIAEEGILDNNPNYSNDDIIDFNFFGRNMKIKVHLDKNDESSQLVMKFDNVLNMVGSSSQLWNYLYLQAKKWIDDVNDDPYFDGKTCKSGKDLINSVEKIDYIGISEDNIFVCGEYWIDPEHGFSINFPNGKFVKLKKDQNRYDKNWHIMGTAIGQYSDAL